MALEALERGDIKRLPGGIFTRAFVRAYAAEVGLDPDGTVQELLAQFPHESIVIGRPGGQIEDHLAIEGSRRTTATVLSLVLFSVPVASIIVYVGLRPPATAVTPALAPAAAARPLPIEPVGPAARPPEPVSPLGPQAAVEPPAPVRVDASVPAAASDTLIMVIEPHADCWISLTVDGAKVPSEVLASGERRELKAAREIVVTVGDGAACVYTLNGTPGRALGAPGEVVTRRISVENYRTYLAQ